jgi:hypothetical protein
MPFNKPTLASIKHQFTFAFNHIFVLYVQVYCVGIGRPHEHSLSNKCTCSIRARNQ